MPCDDFWDAAHKLLLPVLLVALPVGAERCDTGLAATDRVLTGTLNAATDPSPPDSTGTLIVRVAGLNNSDGTVRVELDTEQSYGRAESVRRKELPIRDRTARWTLSDVPYGTYAIALYHDQNGNDELDTGFFGRPQEPYGFSNDARGTMGPPDFEEAAFTLASDSLSITVTAE